MTFVTYQLHNVKCLRVRLRDLRRTFEKAPQNLPKKLFDRLFLEKVAPHFRVSEKRRRDLSHLQDPDAPGKSNVG